MPVRNIMIWLILLSFFIVFIIPFRLRLRALGGLLLLILVGFLFSQPKEGVENESRGIIPIEQIEFTDIDLRRSRGVGWEFTGKLLNHSNYTLAGFGAELVIKDCLKSDDKSEKNCIILENINTHVTLLVLSGENKEFSKRLYFRELHPRGFIRWEYKILYTEVEKKKNLERCLFVFQ